MTVSLLVGSALLLLGTAALVVGVFRTMTHVWTFGAYEIWVLPLLGVGLLLLGHAVLE